jgi:hypothetical protein
MVWAAIGYNRKSRLIFLEGSITSAIYIAEVLDKEAIPFVLESPGYVFQQDNARPHSARATVQHLQSMCVEVLPWPAKSPDLNPIEHLWDVLGRRVRESGTAHPRNLNELRQRLLLEWNLIPQDDINKLCSM